MHWKCRMTSLGLMARSNHVTWFRRLYLSRCKDLFAALCMQFSNWENDLFLQNCLPPLTDLSFKSELFLIAHFEVYLWLECASYYTCVHWWNLKKRNCYTIILASRMAVSVISQLGCRVLVFFFVVLGCVNCCLNRSYSSLPLILFYSVRKLMHCKCHITC
jgi:hypothetical protein